MSKRDKEVTGKPEEGAQAPSAEEPKTKEVEVEASQKKAEASAPAAKSAPKPKPKRHPVHPEVDSDDGLAPLERIRMDNEARQQQAKADAVKAAADAEEMAKLAATRAVVLEQLEDEGRKALEKMPAVRIRNAVEERRAAMMDEIKKWRPRSLEESLTQESVGVWKSDRAVKKLGLDQLPLSAELVFDTVPEPGCSINGVVFAPGSYQLLPGHIWRGIKSRVGERRKIERNFYYPTRLPVQVPGKVFEAKPSPPPMWVR